MKQIFLALVPAFALYWLYSNFLLRTGEGQRSVIIRFNKLFAIHGPGVAMTLPGVDKVITIDLAKEVPNWRGLSETEVRALVRKKVTEMLGTGSGDS